MKVNRCLCSSIIQSNLSCVKFYLNTFQEILESKYLKDVMSKYGNIDVSNISLDPNNANKNQNFVPRSSYTNQIMDILKNVAHQKEETARVKITIF